MPFFYRKDRKLREMQRRLSPPHRPRVAMFKLFRLEIESLNDRIAGLPIAVLVIHQPLEQATLGKIRALQHLANLFAPPGASADSTPTRQCRAAFPH